MRASPVIKNKTLRKLLGKPKNGNMATQIPITNKVFSFLIPFRSRSRSLLIVTNPFLQIKIIMSDNLCFLPRDRGF